MARCYHPPPPPVPAVLMRRCCGVVIGVDCDLCHRPRNAEVLEDICPTLNVMLQSWSTTKSGGAIANCCRFIFFVCRGTTVPDTSTYQIEPCSRSSLATQSAVIVPI